MKKPAFTYKEFVLDLSRILWKFEEVCVGKRKLLYTNSRCGVRRSVFLNIACNVQIWGLFYQLHEMSGIAKKPTFDLLDRTSRIVFTLNGTEKLLGGLQICNVLGGCIQPPQMFAEAVKAQHLWR